MNLLFLSTDGALTNQNYISLLFKRGPNYIWNHQNQIDKSKINYLNFLVSKSKCSVVFTGQWRYFHDTEKINDMLKKSGANFQAIDSAPYLYKFFDGRYASPSDEIEKYISSFEKRSSKVDKFVILDSYSNYDYLNTNLVKINGESGLRHFDVEKCLDKFDIGYKKY